jgi:Xaa-Pro aminopeptidase
VARPDTVNFERLERGFQQSGLDALVAASTDFVFYFSGVPVRYSPGWERISVVVWPRDGSPTLIVPGTSEALAKSHSWFDNIRTYTDFVQSPMEALGDVLREQGMSARRVGLQMRLFTVAHCEQLSSIVPEASLEPCDLILDSVRSIKTKAEISLLREAYGIGERAIRDGFRVARIGMTGRELLDIITANAVAQGAERGASSLGVGQTLPHSARGAERISDGDQVRVDLVGRYKGYHHDVGRTALAGKRGAQQRDIYRRFRAVQRKIIDFMAPGVRACDVYWRGLRAFQEEGLHLWWVIPHMGHNVGVGIHEQPMIQPYDQRVLETDMTFAIEPVYVNPKVGTYHIEDLVHITETGSEILSNLCDTTEPFVIGD